MKKEQLFSTASALRMCRTGWFQQALLIDRYGITFYFPVNLEEPTPFGKELETH